MAKTRSTAGNGFFVETTFVLFFLSLDFGQNLFYAGFDTLFLGMTILAIAVFPYFLPSAGNISSSAWLVSRSVIIFSGLFLGIGLFQTAGTVLPEAIRFVPLTMAMISGLITCYLMISNVFRVSYAD